MPAASQAMPAEEILTNGNVAKALEGIVYVRRVQGKAAQKGNFGEMKH